MSDSHIRIAKIAGAHGLKGRLKIVLVSDIAERFSPGNRVYIKQGSVYAQYTIKEFNAADGKLALIHLSDVDDRNAALSLRGKELYITREEAERTRGLLEEGTFYYYDLIGCNVFLRGEPFGRVKDIISGSAGDLLVIGVPGGREFMVPFVESMVETGLIGSRRIDINPVEGLLD